MQKGFTLAVALIAVCVVAACAAPRTEFSQIKPVRVHIGESKFDVRVNGLQAEAIRRNVQWAPNLASVGVSAVLAIEEVSGCKVAKVKGDQALLRSSLDCGDGPPDPSLFPSILECESFELGQGFSDLVCFPYP